MIEPLSPAESTMIGRYRIRGVLGAGGMGRVLLATGPDGRFVAIKQIHAHLLDDREFRARFEREVAVSARVSGAFTAAVVDFDTSGETPWLASLFIAGVPLDRAIREHGPLPVPALRTLASGLASALHSIHSTGLVHRDLKPANVILAADGPRVIDFGIAQAVGTGAQLTEVGAVVGSPAYMSPEQAMSEPVASAADVFSLGSLLCMAATGDSPFAANSAAYTLFNIVHSEPRLDAVPPELRELIGGCLRKDPAARPTPAQILDYLGVLPVQSMPWPASVHAGIAEQSRYLVSLTSDPEATQIISSPIRPDATVTPPSRPPGRTRTKLAIGVAAAAAVVVAATTAVVIVRDEPAETTAAPASLPGLAQLREVSACDWLPQALGPTLPADIGAGSKLNVADWQWQQTSTWGCQGTSGAAELTLEIGTALDGFTATGDTVHGLPLRRRGIECALGVGAESGGWGITLATKERTSCALAEYAVERVIATMASPPRAAAASGSLSGVDPCALVDDAEAVAVGATAPGTPVTAHTCEWRGANTIRLTLSYPLRVDLPTFARKVVDVGDGVFVDALASTEPGSECLRMYRFREIGQQYLEVATLQVRGAEERIADTKCPAAESVLKSVVGRLPQ
ncbi:serine/threonine-protein kinase [Nocardia neocaledoniensis]|uniref:serine/threonine-protein kinase n=1 Tax=Nocardia neocaledoniensis TaxID=236511 RepID=UPI002455B7FD|nr:serine/threonine-protein kinase [Nocardia neocaledoniensis]